MICTADVSPSPTLCGILWRDYAIDNPLERSSVGQMNCSLNKFDAFLQRMSRPTDFQERVINEWLVWMAKVAQLAPDTCKSKRKDIVTLWNYCAEKRLCPPPPKKLRGVKIDKRNPDAWTLDQLDRLIGFAAKHRHGPSMVAVMLVCWDTCCRIRAVHSAPVADFDPVKGTVELYETKTRTKRAFVLSPHTLKALAKLPPGRKLLCGDWTMQSRWKWLGEILKAAGYPVNRRQKFHKIRRSKYTAVSIRYGQQDAAAHHGHAPPHQVDGPGVEPGGGAIAAAMAKPISASSTIVRHPPHPQPPRWVIFVLTIVVVF